MVANLRLIRKADNILLLLKKSLPTNSFEYNIIQREKFRPIINKWAAYSLEKGINIESIIPPVEIINDKYIQVLCRTYPIYSKTIETLKNYAKNPPEKTKPEYPFQLRKQQPSFPFSEKELKFLREQIDSMDGTEMNRYKELPEFDNRGRLIPSKDYPAELENLYEDTSKLTESYLYKYYLEFPRHIHQAPRVVDPAVRWYIHSSIPTPFSSISLETTPSGPCLDETIVQTKYSSMNEDGWTNIRDPNDTKQFHLPEELF